MFVCPSVSLYTYLNVNFLYLCFLYHCGLALWVWPSLLKTLTLLIIFNSKCYNFHIAECQHLLWQNLCTGIVEIFVLVTRSSLEWLLWRFGGGGCISQNSTHLVGFLSFFLYFSYEFIYFFWLFLSFSTYILVSLALNISALSLILSFSLSFSSPICSSICLSVCL